jgi:hypothetical protein
MWKFVSTPKRFIIVLLTLYFCMWKFSASLWGKCNGCTRMLACYESFRLVRYNILPDLLLGNKIVLVCCWFVF